MTEAKWCWTFNSTHPMSISFRCQWIIHCKPQSMFICKFLSPESILICAWTCSVILLSPLGPSSPASGVCVALQYPWLIVSANHGSKQSRDIKSWQLTSPVATASAVRTAHVPVPIWRRILDWLESQYSDSFSSKTFHVTRAACCRNHIVSHDRRPKILTVSDFIGDVPRVMLVMTFSAAARWSYCVKLRIVVVVPILKRGCIRCM